MKSKLTLLIGFATVFCLFAAAHADQKKTDGAQINSPKHISSLLVLSSQAAVTDVTTIKESPKPELPLAYATYIGDYSSIPLKSLADSGLGMFKVSGYALIHKVGGCSVLVPIKGKMDGAMATASIENWKGALRITFKSKDGSMLQQATFILNDLSTVVTMNSLGKASAPAGS